MIHGVLERGVSPLNSAVTGSLYLQKPLAVS